MNLLLLVTIAVSGALGVVCVLLARRLAASRRELESVRRSEKKYAIAFHSSPDAITLSTLGEGRFLDVNEGFTRLTGFTRDETLDHTSIELGLWENPTDRQPLVEALRRDGFVRDHECRFHKKSGEIMICLISGEIIDYGGGPAMMTVVRDVTAHKAAENALRLSEAKFATAFRSSPDALTLTSLPEGRILEINEGFTRLTGYSREEILGRTTRDVGLWLNLEDRQRMLDEVRRTRRIHEMEIDAQTKAGEPRTCVVSAEIVDLDGQATLISLIRDVSAQKEAEAEKARALAEIEAKNAELERFTYTVSHDLKSPLITIRGFLKLVRKDADAGRRERMERDLERIDGAAARMQELLDDLLELSRVGRLVNPSEEVALGELARQATEQLAGPIAERGVEVTLDPDMPRVVGDRVRLLGVFQNLIENAVKFIGDEPEPRIEIGARRRRGEVCCWVRDNGLGIEPRYQKQIFGLFSRLDPQSEGTGIGLALVERIIETHGGRLWVESAGAGRCSTFFFTLKPAPQAAGA